VPLYSLSAFILRWAEKGETDKLVTLYSKERGKIKAVAKGARKPQAHWGGSLEPLTLLDILVYEKNGFYTITQWQIKKSFRELREDANFSLSAFQLIELVETLTMEEDTDPQLFRELEGALSALSIKADRVAVLNAFRLRFLTLEGFWPGLENCISCGKKIEGPVLIFNQKAGGVLCSTCSRNYSGNISLKGRTKNRVKELLNTSWDKLEAKSSEDNELEEILSSLINNQLTRRASVVSSYIKKMEKENIIKG